MDKVFFLKTGLSLSSEHKNWLAIMGITCVGLALRFYKLEQWSFHVDEIATVHHTVAFPKYLTINPIIYLLLWLWKEGFGISEWSMRFIPSVIGVITIPLLYLPMKRMFNPLSALVACALISLAPWHLFWSQAARYYTLVFLLGGVTAFCFYFALEQNNTKLLIGSLLLTILTILSHTPALLILPAMVFYMVTLWILPVEKPGGLNKRNFVMVICVIALPALTFLLPGFFSYLISGWTVQTWGGGPIYVLLSLTSRIGIPVCIVALLSLIHLLRHRDRRGVFLMSFVFFPLVIVLCGAAFANVAAYYLFYTVPLYFLLAGYGAVAIFNSQRTKTLSLAVILILLVSFIGEDFLYFGYQNGGRAKWREAFFKIAQAEVSDYTVVAPGTAIDTAEYYLQKHDNIISTKWLQVVDNDAKGQLRQNQVNWLIPGRILISDANMLKNNLSEDKHVWFVMYRQASPRTDVERELYQWIPAHCRLVAEYPVFYMGPKDESINVFLYPPNTQQSGRGER